MSDLFRFSGAVRRHPEVEAWFLTDAPTRRMAELWFARLRSLGEDVREMLHDGHPTACVDDAAFAYVDAFTAHVNVGFYRGALLDDPAGLLEGGGKRMRHVKVRWGALFDENALQALLEAAYQDMRAQVDAEA
jgi:hypothetical protein